MSRAAESHGAFVPFALPDIGEEEIEAVVATLRAGWITTGPKTREFEQAFGDYLGGGLECVAVNSATAGLHLALAAVDISPGDEVIVPTHTFTATAEVVGYLGAEPRLVDIDPKTYCLDPEAVAAAISSRTAAILPVHYGGLSADMNALMEIAGAHGLKLVEDAAHAFPTRYRGELVGTLESDGAVFSFYATKTIATGEGGMLVTRNPELARSARVMRLHGIDRDAFDRYSTKRPSWYYEVVTLGFKYNLTDVASAMGLEQLKKADAFHARREYLAERYIDSLRQLPLVMPPRPEGDSTHAWHLFVIQLGDDVPSTRDEVIRRLHDLGVGCSVHYIPLHRQPYWKERYSLSAEQFPNSERLFQRAISLPIYTRMTDEDQDRVIEALHTVVGDV
ncbi:MAG: DegT/DnrJ/EryC1/StrS family aminotransferase [Gammaproteobacteria bacterium]|nr:DegT/DnrJ/EryC1/StrS family aminotransferase [Gammaproteobacteria bacterium]